MMRQYLEIKEPHKDCILFFLTINGIR
ncbi:MAG: hypothetical protein LBT34_02585 [Clostridiales Family XIII bacterium]|nr:hypothetical protein [Clostridiales Family XIII bacterium]